MNPIYKSFLLAAAFTLLSSCAKENIPQIDNSAGETVVNDDILNGWVRIKLSRDAQPLRVGVFTRGEAESGNSGLDVLASQLGATEIRRVFNEGGKYAERRRKAGLHLWYDIRIDDKMPVSRAQSEVSMIPGVELALPIYRIRMADKLIVVPAKFVYAPVVVRPVLSPEEMPFNDPDLKLQWHYYNDGSMEGSVAGADINLFEGWKKFNAGHRSVIVADIDDGFDVNHEDLKANLWVNAGEIPGNGIDDDNNGYIDDINGWNYIKDSGKIQPASGHGTHTGGTIAAVNNNGIGVGGVAGGTGNDDGVRLMCIQIDPGDENARFVDAFAYAADNGAVITSNSWVQTMDGMPQELSDAIDYFNMYAGCDDKGNQAGPMKGGLNIFAAGNFNESGAQYVGRPFYPAADPRVIGVAAIGPHYKKTPYSQYGQGVDVIAPGGENAAEMGHRVYSTLPNNDYGYVAGTSMATPHVTGVAALIVSQYGTSGPGFTADDLRRRLIGSCRDIGAYQDKAWRNGIGAGLVDVARMDVDERNPSTNPQWNGEPVLEGVADGIHFSCKVPADGTGEPMMWVFLNISRKDGSSKPSNLRYGFNSEIGETFDLTLNAVGDKVYDVEVYLQDRYGNSSERLVKEIKSLPHVNRKPVLKSDFSNIMISKADPSMLRTLDVSSYFRDLDIGEFGDELTYSVSGNSNEDIAKVTIAGSSLKIEPKAAGSGAVKVRATDKAGDFAEGTFQLSVLFAPLTDMEIQKSGSENIVRLALDGNLYSPEGNIFTVQTTSSAPSVVKAAVDRAANSIVITPIAKGEAVITLNIKGSLQSVQSIESSFVVKVLDNGGAVVVPGSGASVYPNPADDFINLSIGGVTAGSEAEVRFYDSASRLVKTDKKLLNDKGIAMLDVSNFSPGTYSVIVSSGSETHKCSLVKK